MGVGDVATSGLSLYRAAKTLAGVARYPLSLRPVIAFQHRRLEVDPTFRERWASCLRSVSQRISPRDEMYFGTLRPYFAVGLSGLECVEEAMDAAGIRSVERVLDLPSGHGRVLRFLVARFPDARFTACDLNRDGVRFCADTFGARAIVSRPDIDALMLDESFDLIWCGSLVTHLDGSAVDSLLRFFHRHLTPSGLLVFSTHGEQASRNLRDGKLFRYGLDRDTAERVLRSYATSGFGYADYAASAPGYGVSFTAPAWIRNTLAQLGGWREVYFGERRWDGHHDIFGVVRAA